MNEISRTFTSESVTQGHPDKVADIISDAILDAYMAQDKNSHVACETCVTTNFCMVFGEITSAAHISDDEIELFYDVLSDNQKKFNKTPIHSIEELLDLKNNRLKDIVQFFGVYSESELIAGSMVFCFDKNVFHTQYLACRQDQTDTHANEFLYKHLIDEAKKSGFAKLSFGTSTLEGGKVLNKSLAQFKEGFGTTAYVNRTYRKNFDF